MVNAIAQEQGGYAELRGRGKSGEKKKNEPGDKILKK